MDDEIDRLRRLVPERPDWHLNNWGRWRRGYCGVLGYADHSTCLQGLGGVASEDSSEHVFEREIAWLAKVADSIIMGMRIEQRIAISQVYEASVWKWTRGNLEQQLLAAVEDFWIVAKKRGMT